MLQMPEMKDVSGCDLAIADTTQTGSIWPSLLLAKSLEASDWECELCGVHFTPFVGDVPNIFHRWMQRLFFGCVWRKKK